MDNYVQIMVESLEKKSVILDRILVMNDKQAEILNEDDFGKIDWDRFNVIMAEKEAEIDRINTMDEGFQALYDRIGDDLKKNKDKYREQIKRMQELIVELESKSVKIRTGEEKNRVQIEKLMTGRKKEIKQARTSLKAATNYYQVMQNSFKTDSSPVDI